MASLNDNKVLIGIGGSIESIIAAALLKTQGYDVHAVYFDLRQKFDTDKKKTPQFKSRCTAEIDLKELKVRFEKLDIPFRVVDYSGEFVESVEDKFVHDLLHGRKPAPCTRCSCDVIIGGLVKLADEMGVHHIATGHYVQIDQDTLTKQVYLKRAVFIEKDQSYFLYRLKAETLSRLMTPLGSLTLTMMQKLATEFEKDPKISVAPRKYCFSQSKEYLKYVESRVSPSLRHGGTIMNREGMSFGEHGGIFGFHIGQKENIGISAADNKNKNYQVVGFSINDSVVLIGSEKELYSREVFVSGVSWANPIDELRGLRLHAKSGPIAEPALCRVTNFDNHMSHVEFDEDQFQVVSGSPIVFYINDRVIGGGVIETVVQKEIVEESYVDESDDDTSADESENDDFSNLEDDQVPEDKGE